MSVELFGKCKELGHCDCGGFFGCQQPTKNEYTPNDPLIVMVECQVCDRSHAPNHPHIANIDGDDPIDSEPTPATSADPSLGHRPIGRAALPDWLKDKPGAQMIKPASPGVDPQTLCQVCGEAWAPRHECKLAKSDEPSFNGPMSPPNAPRKQREYVTRRLADTCDVCGLIKRSNHNCKGKRIEEPDTVRAVRDYQAIQDSTPTVVLPPSEVRAPIPAPPPAELRPQLDPELAAMAAILEALDGLNGDQVRRVWAYIEDRKGIKQGVNR